MKESFNVSEPIVISREVIESKPNPEELHSAKSAFSRRFHDQFLTDVVATVKNPDGSTEEMYDVIPTEGAERFVEGLKVFFSEVQQAYDSYWETEISKTGNQFHKGSIIRNEQLAEFNDAKIRETGWFDRDTVDFIHLAFDLFVTIRKLQPDKIIVLVNGAARLRALCQALGFDSNNYLSIHRNIDQHDYRKNLAKDSVYEGEPVTAGSRVLLLEDTSSLEEYRTYKEAREWLKKRGVLEVSVFLEFVTPLDESAVSYAMGTNEKRIEIQDELNKENCYNSFSRGEPDPDSSFWTDTHNPILRIIKEQPEIYDEFFDFIKSKVSN